MEEGTVTAHAAIHAQGLRNLTIIRVHQEKLIQNAGADDERSAPADYFLTRRNSGRGLKLTFFAGLFAGVGTFRITTVRAFFGFGCVAVVV